MNYLNKLKFLAFAVVSISLVSCSNDDEPVNEEEVITTVVTTLTNGNNVITLTSRDLDGDGPNQPVITSNGTIQANTLYQGQVTFLNETVSPAENITEEVEEEGLEHQLFFQLPSSLGTISYSDEDENGNPIGLRFTYNTNTAATGNLIITLRHEPVKSAQGVSNGDITNAGGSTDAQVIFPIVVN
jgi:hypothetical protein